VNWIAKHLRERQMSGHRNSKISVAAPDAGRRFASSTSSHSSVMDPRSASLSARTAIDEILLSAMPRARGPRVSQGSAQCVRISTALCSCDSVPDKVASKDEFPTPVIAAAGNAVRQDCFGSALLGGLVAAR
jgi:hypothetical protein